MAPRANWKGFLRLSLVTCPVALYPATSDSEKVSFNQINRKTGGDNQHGQNRWTGFALPGLGRRFDDAMIFVGCHAWAPGNRG